MGRPTQRWPSASASSPTSQAWSWTSARVSSRVPPTWTTAKDEPSYGSTRSSARRRASWTSCRASPSAFPFATPPSTARSARPCSTTFRRVVRPGGRLAVWIGIVDEGELRANALGHLALPERRPLRELIRAHGVAGTASRAFRHLVWNRARAAATTLRLRFARRRVVAEVYADRARYHFSFFEADDVLELLRQTRFRVLASVRVETEGAGTSLFVLAEAVD